MQLTNKLNNSTYTELSLLCDKLKKKNKQLFGVMQMSDLLKLQIIV